MGQSAMVLVPVKMEDIKSLQDAILSLHGCDSTWSASVFVNEAFQGKTVWQGEVEVFQLQGHPEAELAYVWSHITDKKTGKRRFIAVLGIPPINSAVDAVRASIATEGQS